MLNRHSQTPQLRRTERVAFDSVMLQFYDLRGAIGCSGAIDYSKMQGGSGPMFSDHEKSVGTINFVADVINIARRSLAAEEFGLFKSYYLDQAEEEINLDIVPDERHAKIKEKLGRSFRSQGMHPLTKYFGMV